MTTPLTSRAVVSHSPRNCSIEDLPVPRDLGGGVLVEVEAAAVCGSDWEHYNDTAFFDRGAVVLGHETVGTVVAIGAGGHADRVALGDRVIIEETVPCGRCTACRDGNAHRCPATDFRRPGALRYGRTPIDRSPGLWGGFSELLYVHPRTGMHPVPKDLDPHVAAFANPVANGLRWLGQVAGLQRSEHVLVLGPGAHGLGCVLAARASGAGTVVAAGLDRDEVRLTDAKRLGADLALRTDVDDVLPAVLEATGGAGVDVVVDLVPKDGSTLNMALEAAAPGGRILLAGHKHGDGAPIAVDEALRKELSLFGVRGPNRRSIAASVAVLERYADGIQAMATATYPLAHADQALRVVGRDAGPEASHVIIDPRLTDAP